MNYKGKSPKSSPLPTVFPTPRPTSGGMNESMGRMIKTGKTVPAKSTKKVMNQVLGNYSE
jgi:hypothetical protein